MENIPLPLHKPLKGMERERKSEKKIKKRKQKSNLLDGRGSDGRSGFLEDRREECVSPVAACEQIRGETVKEWQKLPSFLEEKIFEKNKRKENIQIHSETFQTSSKDAGVATVRFANVEYDWIFR